MGIKILYFQKEKFSLKMKTKQNKKLGVGYRIEVFCAKRA